MVLCRFQVLHRTPRAPPHLLLLLRCARKTTAPQIHFKPHRKPSAGHLSQSPLDSVEDISAEYTSFGPSWRLQINSEDPDLKALTPSVTTSCTRALQGSQMLGQGIRPLLRCTIYSKAALCPLQSLFRCVLGVEAIYRDFLGSLLWASMKGPMVQEGTHGSLRSWKGHHGVFWVLPSDLSQIRPHCTYWGRMYWPERTWEANHSWIPRETAQLHLPPHAFRNGLLHRLHILCSDHSGAILSSLSSREQMPQEGMKLSAVNTGMAVSTEALKAFGIEQVSCRKPGMGLSTPL